MRILNLKFKILNSGFTLIEAVVATALFAFVVSSIIGVYLSAINIDRKTRSLRTITQNGRFITEYFTKEVRNGTINYPSYNEGTSEAGIVLSGNRDLYLLNQAGEILHFYPSGSVCSIANPCDLLMTRDASAPTKLNSSAVRLTNYRIYTSPSRNPFVRANNLNEQPRVTIVFSLRSVTTSGEVSTKADELATIDLQITVGSRIYPVRP